MDKNKGCVRMSESNLQLQISPETVQISKYVTLTGINTLYTGVRRYSFSIIDEGNDGELIWSDYSTEDVEILPHTVTKSLLLESDKFKAGKEYVVKFSCGNDTVSTSIIPLAVSLPPTTPGHIVFPSIVYVGSAVTAKWDDSVSDSPVTYNLDVSYNNGVEWKELYSGKKSEVSFIVPFDIEYIKLRVKAVNEDGLESDYLESSNTLVKVNKAPSIPPSLSVPSNILSKHSFTVSWGESIDEDGNLEGYKLERMLNDSGSWVQIYKGIKRSVSMTVPQGTMTVKFRVSAYDSQDLYSGWNTSQSVYVENNVPPNAPLNIIVPEKVYIGDSFDVTWAPAVDNDDNISGYILERKTNLDSEFTKVYTGDSLKWSDKLVDSLTTEAQYRIKAYDTYGEESSYSVSDMMIVSINIPPEIHSEVSENLGEISKSVSVKYRVSDMENDNVQISEYLDGIPSNQFSATLDKAYTFEISSENFLKILNGEHEILIKADDGRTVTNKRFSFMKKVHRINVALREAILSDTRPSTISIRLLGYFPEGTEVHVFATNNANDDAPVWEDIGYDVESGGENYVFQNLEMISGWAIGIRVQIDRITSLNSDEPVETGYLTSVSGAFVNREEIE